MIGQQDIQIPFARVGGTEVNYYLICQKKLWLFSHGIQMERHSDRVDLGRLLHEESYPRGRHKEMMIDGLLRIDFDESSGTIHEIKLSKAFEEAHVYQLYYYLYYLKGLGLEGLKGELNYPKSKRVERVTLTPEIEAELEEMIAHIRAIKQSETCPEVEHKPKCRKCSYEELCWG
ncbi:MAG: CRISPR-associated protein Cas4 [Armatimonadota bacterium]|nr:CRISPR-associated protein Cas4 [Armatimonadota bacterium]